MRSALSCFAAMALVTSACADGAAGRPSTSLPANITLQVGQSTTVAGLRVAFTKVSSDSRCPADAMCIQMGDAYVAFELSAFGQKRDVELQVFNPTNRRTSHQGFNVELRELQPYPFGSRPAIDPTEYRATLKIER